MAFPPIFLCYIHVLDMVESWMQALDTFNTAVVSPIYYVMFTSLTILASVIMFKVICSEAHLCSSNIMFSLKLSFLWMLLDAFIIYTTSKMHFLLKVASLSPVCFIVISCNMYDWMHILPVRCTSYIRLGL